MKLRYVFAALVLTIASVVGASSSTGALNPCPVGVAHRGNAYWESPIENSMNAFKTAYEVGAQWVETDIRFTSDNVPVLMHNATVDATTTGTGEIAKMTAAQFTALTMDDGVQHPPTLQQLLDYVKADSKRKVITEAKVLFTTAQQQILHAMLVGMESQVRLSAFSDRLSGIQQMKQANPALNITLITYAPVFPAPSGVSNEDVAFEYVTAANVSQLQAAGITVRAWTPNNETAWNTLREAGVNGITTNKIKAYLAWSEVQCPGSTTTDPEPEPELPVVPSVFEFAVNRSFENSMTGWTGLATSLSQNSIVSGGYDGGYALRSINKTTATGKHGFISKPYVLDGTTYATKAGVKYTATVWVKPDVIGQRISIYLVEKTAAGAQVGSKTVTITAKTTAWQQITNEYTAGGTGNNVAFHVFATNTAAKAGFNADMVSFTATL